MSAAVSVATPSLNTLHEAKRVRDAFAKQVYPSAWLTRYRGVPLIKQPADLWNYQEIVFEVQPDCIIETGTWCGGSALFLADLCALAGRGLVYTVDIALDKVYPKVREHKRIVLYKGNSIHFSFPVTGVVMVILDSDHTKAHVSAELEHFAPMVTPGSYLIVEDTNIAGNPIEDFSGDPYGAVLDFLSRHPEFEADRSREKYGITQNPSGYLRRVS